MGIVSLENCSLLTIKLNLCIFHISVNPLLGFNSTEVYTYVKTCVQDCLLQDYR